MVSRNKRKLRLQEEVWPTVDYLRETKLVHIFDMKISQNQQYLGNF